MARDFMTFKATQQTTVFNASGDDSAPLAQIAGSVCAGANASGPALPVDMALDALSQSGDLAYVWDFTSDEIRWFGDLSIALGVDGPESLSNGERFHERVNVEDLTQRLQSLGLHMQDNGIFDCEYRLRQDSGDFVWVHEKGKIASDRDGEPSSLAGVIRPITRRKHQERLLEHKATYDELTGHFNKARLSETLHTTLAYNKRYAVKGGYLAVGIDKLAMVNDAYGYTVADLVILGVSHRIERCLRVTDRIGRLGGDRFGIVLPEASDEGLAQAAEKILAAVSSEPINTPEGPIHVTISIGGVEVPGQIGDTQEAMTAAESALQLAKERGRNCYVDYRLSDEQRQHNRVSLDIGEQVLKALDEDRIVFAYQPVVNTVTKETAYYETLLRLREPNGDVIPAGDFVPVAEKMGLMRMLDRRALEIAVADLIAYPDVTLALNISSLTVTDPSWLRHLIGLTKGREDLARRLIVEITETAALEDFELSERFVSAVRKLGCKVALDDFGSGYTSFRHMKVLTVDIVKIDGAFIKDVANSPDNKLFVRTLLGLAEGFGLTTVAECVETEAEVAILEDEGADYLQGWYYGRPDTDPAWRI